MSNIIQTFYVDAAAVNGAEFVALASVDLFFKSRPNNKSNVSGIQNPGVNVSICDVVNDTPRTDRRYKYKGRVEWGYVAPSTDALAVTPVSFEAPVVVQTNRMYGLIVESEDPGFVVWSHVSGERTVGTNSPSPTVTDNQSGKFYQFVGNTPTATQDTALKFAVNVAKFDISSNATVTLTNHGFEFFDFSNNVGALNVGELVYANTANFAGTIAVTQGSNEVIGTGTTFTDLNVGQPLIVKSGAAADIKFITSVESDTKLLLTEPSGLSNTAAVFTNGVVGTVLRVDYSKKHLVLSDSTASATNLFAVGQQLTGAISGATAEITALRSFEIDRIKSNLDVTVGGQNTYLPNYKTVKFTSGSFVDDDVLAPLPNATEVLTDTTSVLASRSTEVANTAIFDEGSVAVVLTVGSNNPFSAPIIDLNNSTLELTSEVIDDQYLATVNGVIIDTEVSDSGIAINKHITKKLTLSEGREAEDLKVYLTAYRPKSTDVRVYAKVRAAGDQEAFDDKLWTPLVQTGENANKFSSAVDKNDLVELEFSIPTDVENVTILASSFTTSANSKIVTAAAGYDATTNILAGDFVKIYNELFPTNFAVTTVETANTTAIIVSQPVNVTGILGAGQKIAKLKYGRTAYLNAANDDEIRYLDSTGGIHDNFVEAQLKVVLLGDPTIRTSPRVDQLEMFGVSA